MPRPPTLPHLPGWLAATGLVLALAADAASAQDGLQARGRITCEVKENGQPASGTVTLRAGATDVASGSCGTALTVPPGAYTAIIRLDGALDRPEQSRPVVVRPGESAAVTGDFATAVLEINVQADGRRAAGLARIVRGGRDVATLGSGVAGHLSTGTYDVVVRYRGREQRFEGVSLSAGERRVLDVAF